MEVGPIPRLVDPANPVPPDSIRKGIPTLHTSWLAVLKLFRNVTKARQGSTSNSTANSQQSPSVPISQQSSGTSQIQRQPAVQTPREPPGITFPQQDSVIPVVTQQTILERLQRCTLASTSKLMADEEAIFEDEHRRKLRDLNGYLDQNRAIWFHGMASRAVLLTLVSITGIPTAEEPTYICIRGLRGEDEIARIHKKLSTKSGRKLYRPLRLCYDTTLIMSASTEDIYEADMTGTQFTLCGTLVQTSHSGSRNLISTVGGLVEIDGKIFAITTSHHLQEDESSEDASSRSPDTSAEGETFDEDVEQALIVDNWKRHCDEDTALESQLVYIPRDQESSSPPWTELGRSVAQGSDWRLLSVEDVLFRPNAILLPSEDIGAPQPSKTFQRGYEEGMSRRYLTSYDSPDSTPSKRGVHIIAGLSGICPGVLSRNVSYLRIGSSQSSIVWTVRLRPGIDLCQGDSGSWVVDAISNSVLGQLVAFSDGLAYLMPLHHVFSEIDQTMKPKRPVCLPSPFNILANLARHRYSTSEGVDDLAYRFASEALTDAVLEADSSNDIVKVIRTGHLRATEFQTLTELLCLTGADVRSAFASPVQWVHSNATDIAKIKTDPTGRTAEYQILRLLHLLWRLDSTFSSSGIITPQPTRGSPAPEDNGLEITSSSLPGVVSKLEKSQSRPASLGPASRARGTQAGSGGLHEKEPLRPQDRTNIIKLWFDHRLLKLRYQISTAPKLTVSIPKYIHPQLSLLLSLGLMMGVGTGGGAVAAVAAVGVDGSLASTTLLTDGALGGLILTLIPGGYAVVVYSLSSVSSTTAWVVSIIMAYTLPFVSTELPVLALSSRILGQIPKALLVAATAAAAPMFGDLALLSPATYYPRSPRVSYVLLLSLVVVGWTTLAGYTFARVADNWGHHVCSRTAAAAAAAVYSAVVLPARLPLTLIVLRRRTTRTAAAEMV